MKISNKENITTLDYRTFDCSHPNTMVYNTSDKKIWYGKIDGTESFLKIQWIFNAGFANKPEILEFLFSPDKEFEIDWSNPKEVLKINRFVNSELNKLTITDLLDLISKVKFNNWNTGCEFGKTDIQNQLKELIGI